MHDRIVGLSSLALLKQAGYSTHVVDYVVYFCIVLTPFEVDWSGRPCYV